MWLTTKEVAEMLNVTERTVQRRAKKGEWKTKYVKGKSGKEMNIFLGACDQCKASHPFCDKCCRTCKDPCNVRQSCRLEVHPNDINLTTPNDIDLTTPNDINLTTPNDIDLTTPNDRPNDTVTIAETTTNKELEQTCGHDQRQTNDIDEKCDFPQTPDIKEDSKNAQGLQCTVNPHCKPTTLSKKNVTVLDFNELQESIEWVDIDSTVNLLGISRQTISKKLKEKQYFSHKIKKPGGGYMTFIRTADLPIEFQEEWKKIQHQKNNYLELPNISDKAKFNSYPQQHKNIAFAWEACILEYENHVRLGRQQKLSITKVVDIRFIEACKHGDILSAQWKLLKKFSIQTLRHHQKEYVRSGRDLIALLPRYKGNVGRPPLHTDKKIREIYQHIRLAAADSRNFSYHAIYSIAEEKFGKPLPFGYRTMCSYIKEHVASDTMLMAVASGKTAYKNKVKNHITRMNDAYPGDLWQGDGHTLNFFVKSPFVRLSEMSMRKILRPLIYTWLDTATEMITGYALSYGEGFDVMVSSLRDGSEKNGIPQAVMVDRGSANYNVITAPDDFAKRKSDTPQRRTARQLVERGYPGFFQVNGINRVIFVIPGNPEGKKIEPAFRYIFATYEKQQFTYLGEKPEKRPEHMNLTNMALMKKYGDKIMSWDEFTDSIDTYIKKYNNRAKKHLGDRSPAGVYAECGPYVIPTAEKLDNNMLVPYVTKVTNNGVRVMGIPFEHPLFINHIGERVEVRYDVRNLKTVKIASLAGEVWATEAEATTLGSYTDKEMSVEAIRARARSEKDRKRVYAKSMKKNGITKPDVFEEAEIMQEMEMEDFLMKQGVEQNNLKKRVIDDDVIETVLYDFIPAAIPDKTKDETNFEKQIQRAFGA